MSDRQPTVGEVKMRVAEGIRKALDGLYLPYEGGPEIVVERDEYDPTRLNCLVPVERWAYERMMRGEFVEYDEPIGCRR
jgi:hypothetical protein